LEQGGRQRRLLRWRHNHVAQRLHCWQQGLVLLLVLLLVLVWPSPGRLLQVGWAPGSCGLRQALRRRFGLGRRGGGRLLPLRLLRCLPQRQ
jgi:hypothetical protein